MVLFSGVIHLCCIIVAILTARDMINALSSMKLLLTFVILVLLFSVSTFAQQSGTEGCTYSFACNFDPDATVDDGSCVFPEPNYDCAGNCITDFNNNGLCDHEEVAGCTFSLAINYDPEATLDNGTCITTCMGDFTNEGQITVADLLGFLAAFGTICPGVGCMDPDGCNFDPEATFDLEFCIYPDEFYDCDGNCINDADGDGVCDELEIAGCTDPLAGNFNPIATDDDGSCNDFPLGSVFCTLTPTEIVDVINPVTGKVWMDRNLGATEVANWSNAQQAYGDLYQWGRGPDGHQCRGSGTTTQVSSTASPPHGLFIVGLVWLEEQTNDLWQVQSQVNNPCPQGYRVPTIAELDEERLSWASLNSSGAINSPLKWAAGGFRTSEDGVGTVIDSPGELGVYWSSTGVANSWGPNAANGLMFSNNWANLTGMLRGDGLSVRCIKSSSDFAGCTDPGADNYNQFATVDDGSCIFEGYSCVAEGVHHPLQEYGVLTDIDGNIYRTIEIGNQEWMAENLNSAHYANGDPIAYAASASEWSEMAVGAWCNYADETANQCPYGNLYNWWAIVDDRNVCPTGWHVPSFDDWWQLSEYLGGQEPAGGKMKSTGVQYWQSPNSQASNESGFSGLPGGQRAVDGQFYSIGEYGIWWGSTASVWDEAEASLWLLGYNDWVLHFYPAAVNGYENDGFSVRCVRD